MRREEVKKELKKLAEEDYKEFNDKLIPGVERTLGVRMGHLRKAAKNIAKEGFDEYFDDLKKYGKEELYYEEIMLRGMMIGYLKIEPECRLKYIEEFIPEIDNWAVCDSFCTSLKFTEKNRALVWDFIQSYLQDEREYFVRFGGVMLLSYFVTEEYIGRTLDVLEAIKHPGYYAKMAAAWAVSVCYVKYPELTRAFMEKEDNGLDDFTYNKSIQKIRESYRVAKEDKEYLKSLKRAKTN